MKLRLFGPGGRVWRLAFRIKHTAKSLKYRQLSVSYTHLTLPTNSRV